MEKSLPVINQPAGSCGSCHSTGCKTCSPPAKEITAPMSRRDLARAAFMGSAAAFLTGCSETKPVAASTQPPAAQASSVSPDLAVVQKSKGPVMTQIDEFFK